MKSTWREEPLLAKRYERGLYGPAPPPYARLVGHAPQVVEAALAIFQKVGAIVLEAADMSGESDRMRTCIRTFGWLHDIGKSNSQWAAMIRSPGRSGKMMLRHEILSGLLLLQPECREWWEQLPEHIRLPVLWAIWGHHRKMGPKTIQPQDVTDVTIPLTHPDLQRMFAEASEQLGIAPPRPWTSDLVLTRDEPEAGEMPPRRNVMDALLEMKPYRRELQDERERRFVGLLKGLAISADVAASAVGPLVGSGQGQASSLTEWLTSDHYLPGLTSEDLARLLRQYFGGKPVTLRPFQQEVADLASQGHTLVLVEAGCGSGKSVAAYLWAQAWCRIMGRRSLFFTMPTTGTATEHFRDYAWDSGVHSTLMHSRAEVDLAYMTSVLQEQQEAADESGEASEQSVQDEILDTILKSEAMRLCTTPLVVCTADTVLGLMANARLPLFSFPALMNGLLVFDEIHAYDDVLFGHLLVFLKHFPRLPVLLMTASLPPFRKRLLQQVRPELKTVAGPAELEQLQRYELVFDVSETDAHARMDDILRQGGKVLYVCNQVDEANRVYREQKERIQSLGWDVDVDVYHARFRYRDRMMVHRKVIDRFKAADKPYLLVVTQVAEMSLDLSADLLITQLAPIPALIQRLGRLNRYVTPEREWVPKAALVLAADLEDDKKVLPYKVDELRLALRWGHWLTNLKRPVSQADLRQAVEAMEEEMIDPEVFLSVADQSACFFSGGWKTESGNLREGGYTLPLVLEQDVRTYLDTHGGREPDASWVREHEIPMTVPKNRLREIHSWRRVRGVSVAPVGAITYEFDADAKGGTGAAWKEDSATG